MTKHLSKKSQNFLFQKIKSIITNARQAIVRSVNITMVITYFEIGRMIVEYEQQGQSRASYAEQILKELSKKLTFEFGKGFSERNLENMRRFFLTYKDRISQTLSAKSSKNPFTLSWSHYICLMNLDDRNERNFYEKESVNENWSVRELDRQVNSCLYTRLLASKNKNKVRQMSKKGLIVNKPQDVIREPYVLEFLGLKEDSIYSESELEKSIIDKLQHFIMEFGRGFLFVGRQQRLVIDDDHYYVDLVFYHRILHCFCLIDLKIGKLKHQDLGQMQMYVNYYDRIVRNKDENKTIGIILCKEKGHSMVKFTLPEDNKQIFASKYKLYMPAKEDLQKQLEEN